MRHALYLPPFGELADPRVVVDLAVAAEEAGWDGIFLWDHMWRPAHDGIDIADTWVTLSAIATATQRLRLGPTVTPLSRRRPQKVAREAVTLDRLSDGRLTLGVGLGVDTGGELERFGECAVEAVQAERLDEALELLVALWSGAEVNHRGRHFTADGVRFLPGPSNDPAYRSGGRPGSGQFEAASSGGEVGRSLPGQYRFGSAGRDVGGGHRGTGLVERVRRGHALLSGDRPRWAGTFGNDVGDVAAL